MRQFFLSRWNGSTPARTLFWWDMVTIGTLINSALGLCSLILLAKGFHWGFWLGMFLVILPYNLFLVLCVYRSKHSSFTHRTVSMVWLGCTLLA